MVNSEQAFPRSGYQNLNLEDVFTQHGPTHGLTELQRRSHCPPTRTAEAEIAVDIMKKVGQLFPLAEADYQELTH